MLYLVELNQEQQNPLSDALLGGPRIGDEAWQLLWGQLFNPPQLEDYDQTSVSEEDDLYFGHYPAERHIPALPQLPMSLRPGQAAYETQVTSQTGDVRPVSPSEPQSDVSSLADNSSALASEELLGQQSMVSSNTSHVFSPPSSSTRQTKSSNTSASQGHETSIPSSPHVRPYSSASHARVRNKPRSSTRRPSHTNSRHNTSRHSIRSTRSYSQSNTSGEGPLYGEAVVVGKIEFDIDNRRGAGKWFDTWIQSASTQTSGESSPLESTQRSSRLVLSRHQPTASASGSLLRSRTLVSEIELPSRSGSASAQDYIQNVKQEVKATEQSSDNEHVLQASEVARPISQASSVLASQSNRDSISEADSVLSSSNEHSVAIPQHTSPSTEDEASISLLHTDQSRSEGRPAVFESSKRASGTSQGSLLSPAQIPISQRSSMEMESSTSGGNFQGLHSERSSSSSFGNEANIEAMNATPRISGPATFASRRSSVSSTPAPSVGVQNHKRQPSETSIASSSEPRSVIMGHQPSPPLSDTVDARKDTAFSEDDAHSRPPSLTSSVYNSRRQSSSSQIEPEEQMVESSLTTETEAADQQASEAFSQHKQLHSRASSVSIASSASFEALDQEEQGYQALEDDEHPREGPQLSVEPANVDDWTAQTTATHRLATGEEDSNESTYEPSEMEDRIVTTGVDLTQGDPLKDIFPSDANTWTQIKYSHDLQEDSATESPAEETVQTALGLGISSSAMLQGHAIPPSASSSLDPFEYDDETGSTLNSPIGPPEDDVKEVADLLKASAAPAHFGLSSPINLGEPSKRLSKQSEPSSLNEPEAEVKQAPARRGHSRAPSQASLASSMRLSAQISSLSPPIDPAMIALPESDSNLSLSNMVSSSSSKSLASIASQPSIWEPETTFTESSKAANRDARLPPDWANQLFAMGNIRSRGNSVGTDAGEAEQVPNLSVANLPQLLSQLGDGTQSRASLASLYAQSARSRSSSVEMMNNLDEIERALAELSPRALKPALGDNAVSLETTSNL